MSKTTTFSPITLTFKDCALEKKFASKTFKASKQQGQIAIIVGTIVYLLTGILDQYYAPVEIRDQLWLIRLLALGVPVIVMLTMMSPIFVKLSNYLLASVGFAAGLGLITIQSHIHVEHSSYYYPLMVLVTFYTYNFIGTRFIFALNVDLWLLLIYNFLFGYELDYPSHTIITHNFFIISSNLIGGAAGYLAERQKRTLFLKEIELEKERNQHLIRSLHDNLTSLPNRELLYDRISQAIEKSTRDGSVHCGFFIDLDGFKEINDTLGHRMGDKVLQEVSNKLSNASRKVDTVSRIGGDEFFILAMDIDNKEHAQALAKKYITLFSGYWPDIDKQLSLTISIGLCVFPFEEMTVSEIINQADKAMYSVKNAGKNNYAFADTTCLESS